LRRRVWLGRGRRLSGRLRRRWRRAWVELVDELYIKDQVGLGRDYRAALLSISELVGNEETALTANVHAFEALIPSGDDALDALLELDRLTAVEG